MRTDSAAQRLSVTHDRVLAPQGQALVTPDSSAACCEVHKLGKCDAVFTCCDECPAFFVEPPSAREPRESE